MIKASIFAALLSLTALPRAAALTSAPSPALLAFTEGEVTLESGEQTSPAVVGKAVPEDVKVRTGPNSSAVIVLANGSKLRLAPNSVFIFELETEVDTTVKLLKGLMTGWIRKLNGRRLNIRTPSAVASVRGTILTVSTDGADSAFELYSGSVWITDRFGYATVMSPNQRTEVTRSRGFMGTSSLPPGTKAPLPPVLAATATAPPAPAPAKEERKNPPPANDPPPLPPPSPLQEVSPSAP